MKKILLCSSSILLLIFISVNAQAYLYYQPPLLTSSSGLPSSAAEGTFGSAQIYDDFMLTTSSGITKITWWGFYYDTSYNGTPSFEVTFYADNSGYPGSTISTSTIGPLTAQDDLNVVDEGGQLLYVKIYSIGLTTPEFSADTRYWLSIYNGNSISSWGWQQSSRYDNVFADDSGSLLDMESPMSNVAFQLDYVPVPEPSVILLLGIGLIGLAIVSRRKINKSC